MKRWIILLVVAALAVALGAWWFSPAQVVKRRVSSLLETLTLEEGSGKPGRKLGIYSLGGLLAEQVELETPTISQANGSFPRPEMESMYSWLCDAAKETRFELVGIDSLEVDGAVAVVDLTLEALVVLPTHRPADGVYDVRFEWRDGKNGWQLESARWELAGADEASR